MNPPVYIITDAVLNVIKKDSDTGVLCIFDTEEMAKEYMKNFVDMSGNGVELVCRYMTFTKEVL